MPDICRERFTRSEPMEAESLIGSYLLLKEITDRFC